MAAKLEDLEYFYGIDKLDRAFSDSAGRLAAMRETLVMSLIQDLDGGERWRYWVRSGPLLSRLTP